MDDKRLPDEDHFITYIGPYIKIKGGVLPKTALDYDELHVIEIDTGLPDGILWIPVSRYLPGGRNPGNDNYSYITEFHADDIVIEKIEFLKEYDDDILKLEETYGRENVSIHWGLVHYPIG